MEVYRHLCDSLCEGHLRGDWWNRYHLCLRVEGSDLHLHLRCVGWLSFWQPKVKENLKVIDIITNSR